MKKQNDITLEEKCKIIIDNMPQNLNNDQKMRYLYHEVGMILSKSTKFFYDRDEAEQEEIYENYKKIENYEVVCRSVVHLFCDLAEKIDINCKLIEITGVEGLKFNHWAIEYVNNDKRYMINPIPDFYRIQMGFSTKSFCSTDEYHGYDGMPFNVMDEEYVRTLDESLGYLSSGMYTNELFDKLRMELKAKLGTHVVRTTDIYQNYYLKMLDLNKNDQLSIEDKLNEIKEIDPEFDGHRETIRKNLESKIIDKDMKTIIHNLSFKSLSEKDSNLDRKRDGASYIGSFDIRNIKNIKSDLLIYKYNYMMNCLVNFTDNLTGYIENKCFMDELTKIVFSSSSEKDCIHRHTVVKETENGNQYYMMFSLKIDDNSSKIYCFYDQNGKNFNMGIEPLSFMIDNQLKPLKDSSLNNEIDFNSLCIDQTTINRSK